MKRVRARNPLDFLPSALAPFGVPILFKSFWLWTWWRISPETFDWPAVYASANFYPLNSSLPLSMVYAHLSDTGPIRAVTIDVFRKSDYSKVFGAYAAASCALSCSISWSLSAIIFSKSLPYRLSSTFNSFIFAFLPRSLGLISCSICSSLFLILASSCSIFSSNLAASSACCSY